MTPLTTATRTTPRRLLALAALALAGVGVSAYLSQHYYEVRNGSAGFHSFCDLGKAMNCDAVAASPYAELLQGLPLSSFACGWFLGLFVIALIARNPFWRREAVRAAFAMAAVGTLFSAVYLGIMAGVIHTYCLLCLVTDALSVSCLGIALSLKPEGFKNHRPELAKWKPMLAIAAVALGTTVLGLKELDDESLSAADMNAMADTFLGSPVISVGSGPEFPSLGQSDAPVTIVEFSDFQCPFCRIGAFIMNSLLDRYPRDLRVVFRNYPLDASCNRKMDHPLHLYACEAAKAAYCAEQQGKFAPVYEAFFENQATFAPGRVTALALGAGVDGAKLSACVAAPGTEAAIGRDVDEGELLDVKSTPTFFINGHKVEGAQAPRVWSRMIERLLKR